MQNDFFRSSKRVMAVWVLVSFFSPQAQAAFDPQALCPVMRESKVQKKYSWDYQGRKVYFCCRSCVKKFKRNPARYPL